MRWSTLFKKKQNMVEKNWDIRTLTSHLFFTWTGSRRGPFFVVMLIQSASCWGFAFPRLSISTLSIIVPHIVFLALAIVCTRFIAEVCSFPGTTNATCARLPMMSKTTQYVPASIFRTNREVFDSFARPAAARFVMHSAGSLKGSPTYQQLRFERLKFQLQALEAYRFF